MITAEPSYSCVEKMVNGVISIDCAYIWGSFFLPSAIEGIMAG